MDNTPGPSPTTTSAPRLARRIRSSPSRRGRPGATMARASLSGELWRLFTDEWYLPAHLPARETVLSDCIDGRWGRVPQGRGQAKFPHPNRATASSTVSTLINSRPGGPGGDDAGTTTRSKPNRADSSRRLGRLVTWRTSPARPTSPTAARLAGRAAPDAAEATASATARSAAG